MQEPRFKQHDKKMDQTGSEIYILNQVFIDALHNCQMQEPRFEQHDKKMDQTGSNLLDTNFPLWPGSSQASRAFPNVIGLFDKGLHKDLYIH